MNLLKKLKKYDTIIIVGAVLIGIFVMLVYVLEELLSPKLQILMYVALYMALFYVIINLYGILKSFRKKSVREGVSVIILIPILFGMLSMIYVIADNHKKRFDVTVNQRYSLSEQSIKIVQGLTSDITFLCFFKDGQPGRELVKTGLEQYQYYSKHIQFEFIDPDRSPQKARDHAIENYGEIVVVAGDKREKIKGEPTEEILTNAILKVTQGTKNVVYVITGHGEPGLDDMERKGLGLLKNQMELDNYDVRPLELMRTAEIPADASCVMLVNPSVDLFEEELTTLKKYIQAGNALLICVDTETPVSVREFLSSFGVTVGNDLIIDKMSQLFGANAEVAVISQYADHAISRGFNVASFFPGSSSLALAEKLPDDFTGLALAYSGPGSWAETNLKELRATGKVSYEENEKQGPIPVGVVLTKPVEKRQETPEGQAPLPPVSTEARIVVFSDADFISNAHLKLSGNKDLLLNTVAWLAGDESLISIRPKEVDATPLYLRTGQSRALFVFPVLVMPLTVLAIGIFVYIRRKRS